MRQSLLALLCAPAIFAQPLISPRAVVNAASFMAAGLPSGSIPRGAIFTMFGRTLGPDSSPPLAFPLSSTLGGVSIKVIQGNTSVNAIPLFVSANQINAIMPSNAPLGMVSIQVTNGQVQGNFAPVRVVNSSFGAFTFTGAGLGPAAVTNFIAQDSQPFNSPKAPAKPNQVVTLYGIGLGPATFPDNGPPVAGNLPTKTEVFVGGKSASLLYNGRSPCCAGLDQIVFTVPADAPSGCFVPVTVRTEGTISGNTVTIAITPDGSPCSEPNSALTKEIVNGGHFGAVLLSRFSLHEDVGTKTPGDITTDYAVVNLRQETGGTFAFNPLYALPPAGSCTAYTANGNLMGDDTMPLTATTGRYLDAGSSYTGAARTILAPPNPLLMFWQIGKLIPTATNLKDSRVLTPGVSFGFTAPGGADVGPIQVTIPSPPLLTWTNRDQTTNVPRTQPLNINWTGGSASLPVAIIGGNVDLPTNSTSLFFCLAPAGSTSFTVPSYILANVPATRSRPLFSRGIIYIGPMPLAGATTFNASGLDVGVAAATNFTGKTVVFQ
ncbi:MAG: hypothetical protein M3O35_01800 [Acidobacteriota bacterium]|nr:hypothetical protein [Acidobacteriota bacterium]